jgi:hypothetical protein
VLSAMPEDSTPGEQIEALARWIAQEGHSDVVSGLERIR